MKMRSKIIGWLIVINFGVVLAASTENNESGGPAVKEVTATSSSTPTPSLEPRTCTHPSHVILMDSKNPQNGITLGKFYVDTDTWNAHGYQLSQTLYVCDYNHWYAVATMNNNSHDGAVKTYPNVHEDFNLPRINFFHKITSSFAEASPRVGIYEWAYDIWLNGVADNNSTEIMIWTDNFHQTPSGPQQGTFRDKGRTYSVFKTGRYIAFVDNVNGTSGKVNLLHFFNYVISKGWIPASSTIGQIDYGVELVSTDNAPTTFSVNAFSLNVR